MIEEVEPIDLNSMTSEDAASDGFASKLAMLKTLKSLYPHCTTDGKQWYRVRFRIDELLPT